MKTIFKSAIVALALAVSVSSSAAGYQFNQNLTIGSRGADVTALQDFLKSTGHFTFPTSTGYFGSVTRAAVAAYQASKGITPAVGFFGPMTRASVNMMTPVVPGTTTTPTTPVVLNGMEGFGEYRLSPTPVNNTNVQVSNDVAVYGVEVKAKNADISFERLTLDVSVVNGLTNENPATLINSISVKDGSTVLATIPVNTSTFSKYSGTNNYYVQISGLSTKVAKDTIKTFTVHFNTNSIDTQRTVSIDVAANGARVVDGRGISTYNASSIGNRTHVFKKPGNSSVLLKSDATTVYSSNYRINALTNGAEKVLTSTFAVKSEQGPSKITSVTVTAATSTGGTMPSNLYLYQGSTLLDARTVSATGSVRFDIENSNIMVNQDQTVTFTVKADMPATTVQGSLVTTTVASINFEKADGASATVSTPVSGPAHFFATVVPMFSKISSTVSVASGTDAKGVSATADIRLNLTASGADILVASTTAVIGLKNASTGTVVATATVSVVPNESGLTYFADGATKSVTLSNVFASTSISATTNLKAFVQSVSYATATGATWFTLPGGFEPFDSDNSVTFNK
jgi:peptidoglycan hydrolase-like protein with peptidoglycan-binding domain